ncbi:MAG TPA: bifunctional nuclease family protein [Anaerolineae bacterium]|nr:bifunctional nuclease family protein [Anaerolineae bacterium]
MAGLIEVQIDSLRVSLTNQQRIVILKQVNADRYLPIWIGPYEAEAITIALQEIEIARPQTHDLIKNVISKLGGKIGRIVISELKDDIYYGAIIINKNNQSIEIDSRPSDAIALAVRTHTPIFISSEVMDEASITPEIEMGEETISNKPSKDLKTSQVEKTLGDERLTIFDEYLKAQGQDKIDHSNDKNQEGKPPDDKKNK